MKNRAGATTVVKMPVRAAAAVLVAGSLVAGAPAALAYQAPPPSGPTGAEHPSDGQPSDSGGSGGQHPTDGDPAG